MDLDPATHPRQRYTQDTQVPVMTLQAFLDGTGKVSLRVGALDIESGLDLAADATLTVDVTVPNASPIHLVTSDFTWDAANDVGTAPLGIAPGAFSSASPLQITVTLRDRAGNSEREEVVVDAVQ
jgi:hypothetical protein